jgi:nucleotide-binding universal stress UspA family protein
MIKLSKILVPIDFSDNSRVALDYAVALGEQFDSKIHILHVLQDVVSIAPEPTYVLASTGAFAKELRKGADEALQKLADAKALAGKKVVHRVREGQPFLKILHYARENFIDLIVMGTHGRTGLAHLLIGSVAENVVRKSRCPVLTVRPAAH